MLEDNTPIRLVKGAYQEPADKAFPKKADVDANYDLLTKIMIDAVQTQNPTQIIAEGCFPPIPAIATHDENRITFAKQYLQKVG